MKKISIITVQNIDISIATEKGVEFDTFPRKDLED